MPQAAPQRDFRRRMTPQDRPFIWRGDDVRRLVPDVQEADCPTHCAQECLRRGPVTYGGQPAALRFAFDFASTVPPFDDLGGTIVLTWDAANEYWASEEIEVTCPDDDDPSTFQWFLFSPDVPVDLSAGHVILELLKISGDPCAAFPNGGRFSWHNAYDFDPLCPNLFLPANEAGDLVTTKTRAWAATYDGSQSCFLCVEPSIATVSVDLECAANCDEETPEAFSTVELPDQILMPLTELSGDSVVDDCCDFQNYGGLVDGFATLTHGDSCLNVGTACNWGHDADAQQCFLNPGSVTTCIQLSLHCVDGSTFYLKLQVVLLHYDVAVEPIETQLWTYLSAEFDVSTIETFMQSFDVTLDSNSGDSICLDPPASVSLMAV